VPAVKAIAPTQKEPPFVIAQIALFGFLGVLASIGLRPEPARPA
jgi:hypothetical protein